MGASGRVVKGPHDIKISNHNSSLASHNTKYSFLNASYLPTREFDNKVPAHSRSSVPRSGCNPKAMTLHSTGALGISPAVEAYIQAYGAESDTRFELYAYSGTIL